MHSSQRAADLVRGMFGMRDEFIAALVDRTLEIIADLAHDDVVAELLSASVAENVYSGTNAIANGSDLSDIDAPLAALEFARRLGQREVPVSALLRAYRVGQAMFLDEVAKQITATQADNGVELLSEVTRLIGVWIDQVSEQAARAYERERAQWAGSKASMRQQAVRSLLTDPNVDLRQAEATLGYSVRGSNIAAELWVSADLDRLDAVGVFEKASALVAKTVVARFRLLVPRDERSMRAWFGGLSLGDVVDDELRAALSQARLPVGIAVGPPRLGVAGFASSANAAARMRGWVMGNPTRLPSAVTYRHLAPLVLLNDDEIELVAFIRHHLGGLTEVTERAASLRESLLVFIEENYSYQAAAERLSIHRNTAGYRVRQALDARGQELGVDNGSLWLALMMCRWRPQLLN